MKGWIGVDLDGTLAHYDGWKGIEHVGAPIPRMVERVKAYIDAGYQVKIFTARVCRPEPERSKVVEAIERWCVFNDLPVLEVTNIKDFGMIRLYDDRAVQVIENTGIVVRPPE